MNLLRERLIVSSLLAATCALCISPAHSQSGKRLEGKVLIPPGGWGPGVTVILYSDDRVRTTITDGDGNFVFAGLAAPARYLEASSNGFRSSSIFITSNTPQPVLITLDVGECSGGCSLQHDVRDRSVRYEERSGTDQLTGSVSEFSGPALPNTTLRLMRADLDATEANSPSSLRATSMNERRFRFVDVAQMFSNERGEFHFTGLEPGWYSLRIGSVGCYDEIVKFWIARETLTRPARMELIREGPGQASPFRPWTEIPLSPAPLPEAPLIPHRE